MFGKTKETSNIDDRADLDVTIGEFFGDESAVAEASRVDHLHQRVTQVEQQISSQFTSLAAYAQIAQEQVELVRSEAQHTNERSEQRVIGLIERERSDRMDASSGGGADVTERLDALDVQVAEIRDGLQQCLSNQKALAEAITDLFAPASGSALASAVADAPSDVEVAPTLTAAPRTSSQNTTLPPPPAVRPMSIEELDNDLAELCIDFGDEVDDDFGDVVDDDMDDDMDDDLAAVESIEAPTELVDGPINGLALT